MVTICSSEENLTTLSFEFLRDRNTFNWLFAFAPVKDIANTCKRIDKIQVRICIYGPNTKLLDTISYTLEDNAYPTSNGKKRIMRDNTRNSVPTGEEELNYIKERMRNNE